MKKAVAIKYNESLPAPFIIAKGRGELVKIMEKIARENGINIQKIPNLADSLIELPVGTFIPEVYYEIIAQLLVFVSDCREK